METKALALIDPLVDRYLNDPAPPGIRNSFGFVHEVPSGQDEEIEKARQQYKTNAQALASHLSQIGVTPLATLPVKFWDRIVSKHGLWDLQPTDQGQVLVYPGAQADEARNTLVALWSWVPAFGVAIGTGIWQAFNGAHYVFFMSNETPAAWAATVTSVLFGIMTLCASLVAIVGYGCFKYGGYLDFYAQVAARQQTHAVGGERALMRLMHTDRYGVAEPVAIHLPTPPAHVSDVLLRLSSPGKSGILTVVHVVVEDAALGFEQNATNILARYIQQTIERERRERAALNADPIIAVHYEDVVAIVAQFGDCPIEAEVVRKAITMDTFRDLD